MAENPADSALWDLPEVKQMISRNPLWRAVPIDRCAYGREEQKPTVILTNISQWQPKGTTGNGRCRAGQCTGRRGRAGRTTHPRQTIAQSKARRVDQGGKEGGRREWTRQAVVNALEEPLLEEVLGALGV